MRNLLSSFLLPCLAVAVAAAPAKAPEKKKPRRIVVANGKVTIPDTYSLPKTQVLHFGDEVIKVDAYASRFAQGHAIYIEIISKNSNTKLAKPQIYLGKSWVPVITRPWGYRSLTGVHTWARVGQKNLTVIYKHAGRRVKRYYKIPIARTKYAVWRSTMKIKNWSNTSKLAKPEVVRQKRRDRAKKKKVFAAINLDGLTPERSHPRDLHKVTSPFWQKRVVARFKYVKKKKVNLKPRITRHHGLDLRGRWGDPIYALNGGKVVIAEKMFFEGGFVLIDHGNKIFSGYMHQSKIFAKEGQHVKAGALLGEAGATGAVTGPHLHVFLRIRGVYVDPLSILPLPIR